MAVPAISPDRMTVHPHSPPKTLLRQVGRAIVDYDMIRDGDRILLGLSGGKDSLSLLHTLLHLQHHAPIHFTVGAATVAPDSDDFDPSPLKAYVPGLGIEYGYLEEPIVERARKHMGKNSYCAFCARMKRGALYSACRRRSYNVLALAQHLDDLAESFLMSAFHEGRLNTMKACYTNQAGDIRIIRPFVTVRERQLADFARQAQLPVIAENCPACFEKPTQRHHMKTLLAREEQSNPHLFKTLLSSMRPLMARDTAEDARHDG